MKIFLKNMAAVWQAIPEILKNLKSLNSSSSKYQDRLTELQIDNYLLENLHKKPKYDHPNKLNGYEFKVFSQAAEDSIISDIFNCIGTTNKFFVEFGFGNGLENSWMIAWSSYHSTFLDKTSKIPVFSIDFLQK